MKKRIWILLVLLGVIIIGGGSFLLSKKEESNIDAVSNNTASQEISEKRHEFIYLNWDRISSLEELENASECIVRVRKESEGEAVVSGYSISSYTIGQVSIQEVFYNTLGDAIQKDKIIEVQENEYPDGDVICHLKGYEKMEIGKEYILFLKRSEDSLGIFGGIYGKVSVMEEPDSEFAKRYAASMDSNVKIIAAQVREKYVQKETSTTSVKRDEYIPAKAEGFSSLEEMENASECIVRVKKESEDVIPSGTDTTGHTMAQVRIQEIFQNTLGDVIQKDKIIEIWENEFPDGDVICHLEGYEKMEIGKEYLLFLRKSMTDDCFIPLGVTYGKVSVVEEPDSEFIKLHAANMDPNVKTIAVQAREKYVQ